MREIDGEFFDELLTGEYIVDEVIAANGQVLARRYRLPSKSTKPPSVETKPVKW